MDGNITSWLWTWTGGSSAGNEIDVSFPVGTNSVILTVVDDKGATIWLSADGSVGRLVAICEVNGTLESAVYDVWMNYASQLVVDLGDGLKANLEVDSFGSLVGELPCIGEVAVDKFVTDTPSEYSGFYEATTEGAGSVLVLVNPIGEALVVSKASNGDTAVAEAAVSAEGLVDTDVSDSQDSSFSLSS